MEAVPRLHMLWFVLKQSPEATSFSNLKKYIAEFYQEDADSYSKEVYALETLRNQAMHPPQKDKCSFAKRYYCQLHSLQNRFPQLAERGIFTFTWKDLYHSNTCEVTEIRYELAAVLFNIAAAHTQVGASVTRGDVDGMKLACTHFQCAAWAFGELRERYAHVNSGSDFMTTELLVFMQQVSYAQAQECILEKSLIDNRKPNIVAKVTAQIVVYYGAALAALLTGGDDGPVAQVVDSSVYKLWKKYVRFKISYLNCILYLYQGQHSEEQQKMGERVTLYQAAWDKLEEARKESKGLPDQKEINESLIFTADVVEAKRKNAKNENEFIYHESIPELSIIGAVQGANLVNGISFSVTDAEVAGEDIFARLVPMKAHEASSLYSEEKAKLLRKVGANIEEKDTELASFMSSLTLDHLNINEEKANKMPQGIVDRCASLNANQAAIPDLISAMSQLAEICADVEMNLKEITAMLAEEDNQESEFQKLTGVKRTPNAHITELTREFQKYNEAHARAGESNDTLRKAMELHVNNLKILSRPLKEIQQSVPKLSSNLNTNEIFKDVKLILNKANEMKAQRSQFHAELRIAVNDDDITAKVIAHGSDEGLQLLFDRELSKHERLTQLIDQNLLAQKNILQALTESYAKAAPVLKTLAEVKHKRESFFSSLAASYDVYEDLLAKSAKGLEFYKKLSGNVQKLLTRFKSARDVQSEERQQRLKSVSSAATANIYASNIPKDNISHMNAPAAAAAPISNTPKLRDYLKSKNTNAATIAVAGVSDATANATLSSPHNSPYIPPIRPNPLGSENPTQAVCSSNIAYYPSNATGGGSGGGGNVSVAPPGPNEPPPPYSLQQTQYYDPSAAGYTNPMYQQQQQNIAPPAYTLQASPNSQFKNLNANMTTLPSQSNFGSDSAVMQQIKSQQFQQQQYGVTTNMQEAAAYMQQQASNLYGSNLTQQQSDFNYAAASTQQSQSQQQLYATANQIPTSYVSAAATQIYTQPIVTNTNTGITSNFPKDQYTPKMYDANVVAAAMNYPPQQQQQAGLGNLMSDSSGVAPSVQQIYASQMNMNQQYQQPQSQFTSGALPSPAIPTTQPLYVATTQHDATPQQQVPPSLQAPYVVNHPMQQVTLTNQPQFPQQYSMVNTNVTAITSSSNADDTYSTYSSSVTKHPGYSFNQQTGNYEYGSGYHQTGIMATQFYGQYTSASAMQHNVPTASTGTTDSENANKSNLATGFDSPIISHTKSGNAATTAPASAAENTENTNQSYYTPPYGYHSHGGNTNSTPQSPHVAANTATAYDTNQMQQNQTYVTQQQVQKVYQQHSLYMQSGSVSTANTQTTKSAAEYASSSEQQVASATPAATEAEPPTAAPTKTAPPQPIKKRASSNMDLLSDIDFSGTGLNVPPPILPTPTLKPEVLATPPASEVDAPIKINESDKMHTTIALPNLPPTSSLPPLTPTIPLQLSSPVESSVACKSSLDNLSICSELSSLDNNFDWDSVSVQNEKIHQPLYSVSSALSEKHSTATSAASTFQLKPFDPFTDAKVLKYFHKEVERYEKAIENLNIKMLNGNTQLSAKWKELHDLLAKEESKRTTIISKLFPEKNRSLDCIPYDHARVKLEKNTDDYINAAYVKNLGAGCPNLIIAQTPQQNTTNDFWSMIWSQKARSAICLHTPNEMLDPFWPQELNKETQFDDFSVKCVKVNTLSHCIEYNIKLSMHGADAIIDLSVLQIKAWTKSSPSQVIGIARNTLQAHQHRCLEFNAPSSPLIMNCLTGSERSELVAIAICAILATQSVRPVLINVVDVWYRICTQRQNALRDTETLEQTMQIVLNHAHDVLNKRGIMTSYQMKIAPQIASKEKEEIKDPLNELDPLWKLK